MKGIEENWMTALALLTMTMSFNLTMHPPGGFSKQGDPEHLLPGIPKLASSSPRAYSCLIIILATAFVASATNVLLLVMSFIMSKAFEWRRMLMMVTLVLVTSSMLLVYGSYLRMLAFPCYGTAFYVLVSLVRILSYLMLFLLPGHLIFLVVKFVWRKIIE